MPFLTTTTIDPSPTLGACCEISSEVGDHCLGVMTHQECIDMPQNTAWIPSANIEDCHANCSVSATTTSTPVTTTTCCISITDVEMQTETFSNGGKSFKLTLADPIDCVTAKVSIDGGGYVDAEEVRHGSDLVFVIVTLPGPTQDTNVCFKVNCCDTTTTTTTQTP